MLVILQPSVEDLHTLVVGIRDENVAFVGDGHPLGVHELPLPPPLGPHDLDQVTVNSPIVAVASTPTVTVDTQWSPARCRPPTTETNISSSSNTASTGFGSW